MNAPVQPNEDPWTTPLDRIDVSQPRLYQDDAWQPWFARLRRDDPVHYTQDGMYGSFWSVTTLTTPGGAMSAISAAN